MFDAFLKAMEDSKTNYFRFGVYEDGQYREHHFLGMPACSNIYSISKNITATAVGLCWDRGLLGLDDLVVDRLKEHLPEQYDEKLGRVTIKHLLTQTSGIGEGTLFEGDRYIHGTDDWIPLALSRPMPFEPGTQFVYDNGNYYLLACIVEETVKMPLTHFLQKHLFDHMDIHEYAWERCPKGHAMGATGFYMRIDDMNQFGRLYLDNGVFGDQRLLSEEWVKAAATPYPNGTPTRYGYGFWMLDGSEDYWCGGAYNQMIYISREYNTVVSVQGYDTSLDLRAVIADALAAK